MREGGRQERGGYPVEKGCDIRVGDFKQQAGEGDTTAIKPGEEVCRKFKKKKKQGELKG